MLANNSFTPSSLFSFSKPPAMSRIGDGTTSTAANPSKTYTTNGSYTATLTVTDDQGGSASAAVAITVTEDGQERRWQRRPSLLHSLSNDTHYRVYRDEEDVAWIEFGDDKYGSIPSRGRDNITARYRVGGGVKGNVPPNTIIEAAQEHKADAIGLSALLVSTSKQMPLIVNELGWRGLA